MNFHYLNRYKKLVHHYKNTIVEGFVERHHIIPICMEGTDDITNLVALPPRVHFIAHYLLHKAYPENRKLAHAFAMMAVNNQFQNRKFSSKLYAISKIARTNALKGIPRPEWVKQKLRKPKSNKLNYKKPKSKEHASNISKALTGKPKSKEHIEKIQNSKKEYWEKRKIEHQEKIEKYRTLFIQSGLSRKEFAQCHGISYPTLKRYLKGL